MTTPGTLVRLSDGGTLSIGRRLGRGGESVVHETSDPDRVVKLWHPDVERDLAAVTDTARLLADGWPDAMGRPRVVPFEPVMSENGVLLGVALPRISADVVSLADMLTLADREWLGFGVSPAWRLRLAARVVWTVDRAHAAGVLMADIAPRNIFVRPATATAVLLDADAWQQAAGPLQRRRVAEDVLSPELLRSPGATPSLDADRWALAITVALILLDGRHPFDGAMGVEDGPTFVSDNVAAGHSHLAGPRLLSAAGSPTPDDLPAHARELAAEAFGPGHADPGRRPSAEAWLKALAADEQGAGW